MPGIKGKRGNFPFLVEAPKAPRVSKADIQKATAIGTSGWHFMPVGFGGKGSRTGPGYEGQFILWEGIGKGHTEALQTQIPVLQKKMVAAMKPHELSPGVRGRAHFSKEIARLSFTTPTPSGSLQIGAGIPAPVSVIMDFDSNIAEMVEAIYNETINDWLPIFLYKWAEAGAANARAAPLRDSWKMKNSTPRDQTPRSQAYDIMPPVEDSQGHKVDIRINGLKWWAVEYGLVGTKVRPTMKPSIEKLFKLI